MLLIIPIKKKELFNLLTDLTSNSFTTQQVQLKWTCHSSNLNLVSACNSYYLLGGYNVFGANDYCQITLSSIKPHFSLSIVLTFLKIDAWNSNSFIIYVDSILKSSSLFNINDDVAEHFCATSLNNDAVRSISLNFSHSLSTTTIKFMTDLTSLASIASWGFRDTIITVDSCHIHCASCSGPASSQCLSCYSNGHLSNGMCICNPNYYMTDIIPCSASQCSFCNLCNFPCQTCQGNAINDCLSCVVNTYLLNGVCLLVCPAGKFADSLLFICQFCNINCKTCINSATMCTSCFPSTYLQSDQCVTSCISVYYGNKNN